MAFTQDDSSCEDTTSSLGDSSYDFIDDRSNITSDDEEQNAMTESTTSSDGHEFDQPDVHSQGQNVADHSDQLDHERGTARPDGRTWPSASWTPSRGKERALRIGVGSESSADIDGPEDPVIEFDEPSITNLDSLRIIEVSHNLKTLGKQSLLDPIYESMVHHLQGQLVATVRQSMTSQGFKPEDGSYKLLYIGNKNFKEPIVHKIGTALAASFRGSTATSDGSRSSRFNIVPISSFGEASFPEVVLIDSSGLELNVEDCTSASFGRKVGGNDTLRLRLSNDSFVESTWSGSRFVITDGWRLPDIAIFLLSDDLEHNVEEIRNRQTARSFMIRHAVPCIVISQSPQWVKPLNLRESITVDFLAPHVCVELQKSNPIQAQPICRLPVDISTFLRIDAAHMNRNFACLAASRFAMDREVQGNPSWRREKQRAAPKNIWSFQDICDSLISDFRQDGLRGLNRYEYYAGFVVLLMSLLSIMVVGMGLSDVHGASRVFNTRVIPTHSTVHLSSSLVPSISSSTTLLPISNSLTDSAVSASSTVAQASLIKNSSLGTDIASFLLDAYTIAPNKSHQFEVHVLGDHHIVLRPPHWLTKTKKSSKLLFKIRRGSCTLEHHVMMFFDGMFALQIPREDAYGILGISIWTETKPEINETFEVDLGSSWFRVAAWKKATKVLTMGVRNDLQYLQSSLRSAYRRMVTGVSIFMLQQHTMVAATTTPNRGAFDLCLTGMTKTGNCFSTQTKQLANELSRIIRKTRAAASAMIKERTEKMNTVIRLCAQSKISAVSYRASALTRGANGVDLRALTNRLKCFGRRHLQESQKEVLKAWWKIGGIPKHTVMPTINAKRKRRSSGQKEMARDLKN